METKIVRVSEEAHVMLIRLAELASPKVTIMSMANHLIEQAWSQTVSQPNPDVTVDQVAQ